MSTIFNKIINKEIPADIIYENESGEMIGRAYNGF